MTIRLVLIIVLAIVLVLSLFSLVRLRAKRRIPPQERPIIAFGDSLVEGFGVTAGEDFPSVLSSRLGVPIVNAGRSGDTTAMALARLERDVLVKQPRIVIVLLGGNDALQFLPKEETERNLREIVHRIRKSGAEVLLVGIRGGILHDKFEGLFEKIAEEEGARYVPNIMEGIFGHPTLLSDPIHPNAKGYAMMADRIEPVLKDMLR
jgi:acyl-CoA thioesterase-1